MRTSGFVLIVAMMSVMIIVCFMVHYGRSADEIVLLVGALTAAAGAVAGYKLQPLVELLKGPGSDNQSEYTAQLFTA